MKLNEHPTIKAYLNGKSKLRNAVNPIKSIDLKAIAKECGADDAGLVDVQRETMTPYRKDIEWVMPGAKTILVLAWGLNQVQMQSQAHSLTDVEFNHGWANANESARATTEKIRQTGAKALHMPAGFPFETGHWPNAIWLTSDKIFCRRRGIGTYGHKSTGAPSQNRCFYDFRKRADRSGV